MPTPSLITQTTYAELLERSAAAAFRETFPEDGAFTSKLIKGRRYWYFQSSTGKGRTQLYVGPETRELLDRIHRHKEARDDELERRAIVSTLIRSFNLPRPIPEIGDTVAALAKAGVFRLRGVLVGTVAYQTYSAMLGCRLPASILQTGDIDIAHFRNVSMAMKDQIPPILDILKTVDGTFRAVRHSSDNRRSTSYMAKSGLRIDFLTPNEGPDDEAPQSLPALQTDAQPLRFLDYLIHEPEAAVILHHAGIYVHVPAPERYAVHKLIIAQRRPTGLAKRDKDLRQVEALLEVLAQKRPYELKSAWNEAYRRGKTWRELMIITLAAIAPRSRDVLLKLIEQPRRFLPELRLDFGDRQPRYEFDQDVVVFMAKDIGGDVRCEISREALEDHFGGDGLDREGRVELFRKNRSKIEHVVHTKYLSWPVEEPGVVLIKTSDVPRLLNK
jgi:hypothetical protein